MGIVNRKFWGSVGNQKYDIMMADSTKNLRDITSLCDANKFKAVIDPDSPFKFEDFMKMFEKSMSHKAKGKLVIQIGDDDGNNDYGDKQEEEKDDVKEEVNEDNDGKGKEEEVVKSENVEEEPKEKEVDDKSEQEQGNKDE